MSGQPRVGADRLHGHPLPLYAFYWRRRLMTELRSQMRAIARHRDDIVRVQSQLSRRVSGIEAAMALLEQAVAQLDATPDASPRPPPRPPLDRSSRDRSRDRPSHRRAMARGAVAPQRVQRPGAVASLSPEAAE